MRPRANGLNKARPPMATKGTATAAAAIPARLSPASETADWMELHNREPIKLVITIIGDEQGRVNELYRKNPPMPPPSPWRAAEF